jgi:hypothetical protein
MATATCPRCGQRFDCGAAAATPCACSTLRLEPALLARLRERWSACLCLDCLRALARGESVQADDAPARRG